MVFRQSFTEERGSSHRTAWRRIRTLAGTAILLCPVLSLAQADESVEVEIDTEAVQRVQQLRASLLEMESPGNTWRADLGETLLDLGRALQEANDHEGALEQFERAVHISRINHGLFSLQQLPAIMLQVQSHLALNQWDSADGLRQYAFYVQSRAYQDNDPGLIPALADYAQWNMKAFADRRGEIPSTRLLDAYQLYSVAVAMMDKHEKPLEFPKEEYLRHKAFIAWLMHRTNVLARSDAVFSAERRIDDAWADGLTGQQTRGRNNAFARGEEALQKIIDIRAEHVAQADAGSAVHDELVRQQAEAVLDLGDWHLLFNRRQAARITYREAWDLVADNEAMVAGVFDQVVLLPSFEPRPGPSAVQSTSVPQHASSLQPRQSASGMQPRGQYAYLTMAFDINRFGRATNVNVIDGGSEDNDNVRRRMIGALRDSTLRPRIENGEPVGMTGLVYRFPYEIERVSQVAQ
jgi:tetratricopeptide (TPR) repeat protein